MDQMNFIYFFSSYNEQDIAQSEGGNQHRMAK